MDIHRLRDTIYYVSVHIIPAVEEGSPGPGAPAESSPGPPPAHRPSSEQPVGPIRRPLDE